MTIKRNPPDIGLDYLHARCSEVDGCLVWKCCLANGLPAAKFNRRSWQVRRLVWSLSREANPRPGHYPAMTCATAGCVHPDHMAECRRSANHLGRHRSAATKAKVAQTMRQKQTLTQTAAQNIRASDKPTRQLAEEHGITMSYIRKIRAGTARRDYSNPYSQLVR